MASTSDELSSELATTMISGVLNYLDQIENGNEPDARPRAPAVRCLLIG